MNVEALASETFRALVEGGDMGALSVLTTGQLNVNLVAWNKGYGVASHVNDAVDVALIVLSGTGTLTVDQTVIRLEVGTIALIPRGTTRSIAADTRLAYVTVHRARPALMPSSNLDHQ